MVRVLLVSLLLLCAATAAAAPDEPAAAPALAPSGPPVVTAASRVNDGLAFAKSGDRLRPLDPKEADELAQAIAKAVPR